MTLDRIIKWGAAKPFHDNLALCLKCFVNGIGKVSHKRNGTWYVSFSGEPTSILCASPHKTVRAQASADHFSDERWIEVFQGDDFVNVCTRDQDEITNGIADRLAEVLGRLFGGKVEKR